MWIPSKGDTRTRLASAAEGQVCMMDISVWSNIVAGGES